MPAPVPGTSDERDRNTTDSPAGGAALTAGISAVAAVYVHFLLFAQFGFLKLLQTSAHGPDMLPPVMVAMGLSGIVASILAARVYSGPREKMLLMVSLAVAGAAAGLSLVAATPALFFAVAILTGAGLGGATVALAPQLTRQAGAARLGRCLGWGTGLAYAICNLPGIFDAEPRRQAVVALAAAVVGIIATSRFKTGESVRAPQGIDYETRGLVGWTVIFLTLVWLDSAAFYVIQHTPTFRQETWTSDGQLGANAAVHLVAAVAAGWALDRGGIGGLSFGAGLLLAGACLMLGGEGRTPAVVALCYTAGVSFYSTALVYYPAKSGRPAVAALIYGVAGWMGSALGIGMATDLGHVPLAFPGGMIAALAIALGWRARNRQQVKNIS